jgi:hypothetical protein
VDPDGKDVHIKISNKTNHPVDINKIASIIKSQFEQAGVKDVNVYTGIWGKIKYAFKSLTGGKNMRTVVLDSWDVSGADRGLSNGKINLGGFVKDNEKDLNTAVANTGSHELGHNLAELKDARDENGNKTDDGSLMGTKVKRGTFGNKVRGFSDPDAERLRKQLNEEEK